MFITIFTPAYNRGYTLGRLYESLCNQTDQDFEWVIVDDGSTDNTKELVGNWITENKIIIRYKYQNNAGKPSAHNEGVSMAQGELFTCVDSDDYLKNNFVLEIKNGWKKCQNSCIGLLVYRINTNGKAITELKNNKIETTTLYDGYTKYGLKGDTVLVFKSKLIKKYGFPKFENEKFVPESYLYDQLDQEGKLFILRKGMYVGDYLSDGYTANMAKLLFDNPKGYFTFLNQRLKFDKSLKQRFLNSIRYVGMAIAHKHKHIISEAVYPFWALVAYIPGYLFYVKRYKEFVE